jgi:alkylation response protein AidB-like acyl-CoA dehydrogenase
MPWHAMTTPALDDEDLRRTVRRHLAEHRPGMDRLPGTRSPATADLADYRRWCASLFDAQLVGADWPERWGGIGLHDPLRTLVIEEELARARAPRPVGAWSLVANALLAHGTTAQCERYLPRIRSFEDMWCQLFSEPEAGSDLASLRTTARREGDVWIVDGQKVWTTHAHVSNLGFLLARTDPDAPKHHGIGAFVLDMHAPGVEVRPLREMTGSADFNEVFLTGVVIPDQNRIGDPTGGWPVARDALSRERSDAQREDPVLDAVLALIDAARDQGSTGRSLDDDDVRQNLARAYVRAKVSDLMGLANAVAERAGAAGPVDGAISKVLFSETNLAVMTLAVELLEADGIIAADDPRSSAGGRWQESFLYTRGFTISAGSNEVMRNLIAERGLGLPRQR